jgi:pimeloyl-ACP methyl ester carboxylesterase
MIGSMGRSLLSLLALATLAYAVLCLAMFLLQRSLLYFPTPPSPGPAETLLVDGIELRIAIRAPAVSPAATPPALLYLGGNAEDPAYSLPALARAFPEHALYGLHYRGYGGSGGTPSESALQADALVLLDRLRERHARVTLVGRSLGSGIAVRLAAERPVERLVLVTPYDSITAVAGGHYPWLPVRWLARDRYESWRHAARVNAPTVLLVASNDTLIPRARSDALLRHFAPGVATLHVLAGTDHNNVQDHPDYPRLMR